MSVIVFNTSENAMYADSVVSLDSCTAYNVHKVKRHVFDNGWQMLVGAIGVPAVYAPAEHYLVGTIAQYVQDEVLTIDDLDGRKVLPYNAELFELYSGHLAALTTQLGEGAEFAFLIAITDGKSTALGVMHNSLHITWGVKPLNGRRDLVIGSPMVTSTYNSTVEFNFAEEVPTYKRLESIANVQYIGVKENTFHRYTFDGEVLQVAL